MGDKPGAIFVVATFLPLASFVFLLIAGALRSGLRRSQEDTLGRKVYELLGGDTPPKWPAYVATAAIGLAFLLCFVGAVQFFSDQGKVSQLETDPGELSAKEVHHEIKEIQDRWRGDVTWASLGGNHETRQSTALKLGYKIDHLSVVMFLMVTLIATLIHVFSIGYMSEEMQKEVADHQVHTADGHLHRRGRFGRFFLYMSLFCFSMLNLVLADNLFQVFLSWELVGICSYLLIGYYYERTSASNAANKAFITNRIGDAGFIIGLLIFWTYAGTLNFEELFAKLRSPAADSHGTLVYAHQFVRAEPVPLKEGEKPDPTGQELRVLDRDEPTSWQTQVLLFPRKQTGHFHGAGPHAQKSDHDDEMEITTSHNPGPKEYGSMPYWMLVVGGLGVFLGCVGKSAQFPLHVWLPDAMEGPTPVSALIHAATMVAAGVYLVGRVFPIFTTEALLVIAYTGAITLFVAASIAVVMTDIKKVLAYSTVSQLGYMMLGLGVGGWVAGLFHLVTHAFFKALLFLGSGAVIYGCHHEQDMSKMGGLYPKMKITALTMLMGVLAIAGIPAFSGWYSKDAVLYSSLSFVSVNKAHVLLFVLPLLTAGLTAFYMFRMWFMTFTGKPRDHQVYEHANEAPRVMTTPLIVLAVFSVIVAWGWPFFSTHFPFVNAESSALEHTIHHAQPQSVQADFGTRGVPGHEVWDGPAQKPSENPMLGVRKKDDEVHETQHAMAGNLALVVVIIGMVFALMLYYYRTMDAAEAQAQFPGVHRFLSAKWYFDELYSVILVRPALIVAGWCRVIDMKAIDRFIDSLAVGAVKIARFDGRFDNRVIDGLANLLATISYGVGGWFRRWQTGSLRSYVLFLVLAAVGIFVLVSALMAG